MPVSTKTCFKCGKDLPITEFYAHRAMADGLLGKCKTCTRSDTRVRYYAKHDEVMAYEKKRGRLRGDGSRQDEYHKMYSEKYSDKTNAHGVLNRAVRDGKIVKPYACIVCGDGGMIHAHHRTYEDPLDVVWLCPVHHKMDHGLIPLESPNYRPF